MQSYAYNRNIHYSQLAMRFSDIDLFNKTKPYNYMQKYGEVIILAKQLCFMYSTRYDLG